jgi:hypothetical protein
MQTNTEELFLHIFQLHGVDRLIPQILRTKYSVIFKALTVTSMNMAVFWDVAPYSLVALTDVCEVPAASIIRALGTN